MSAVIKIKNSSTASAVPTSSDLVQGELAVNVADKRVFTKDATSAIVELGINPSSLTTASATITSLTTSGAASFADGSASAPAITNTGDTNTGIFFPAADTIAFAEGGVEAMRLDSAGNMGLGVTPSAWNTNSSTKVFQVGKGSFFTQESGGYYTNIASNLYQNSSGSFLYLANGNATISTQVNGQHQWFTSASGTAGNAITFTQAMTLDASGNLGVGTSSLSGNGRLELNVPAGNNTNLTFYENGSSRWLIGSVTGSNAFRFLDLANGAERARIDSSGNLLVGTTSAVASERFNVTGSVATGFVSRVINQNATSPQGMLLNYSGASPNSASAPFLYCLDTTTLRAEIRSNGGLANYSANNVNLSDARTKTDIQDAGDYLAKICAIPVRTFKYKDQSDDLLSLGVIAQEVEAIAPELVDVSGFGETPEDGIPLKAVYQTDLQYALMKCIQEQQTQISDQLALIVSLTARIEALEA
jgi:hypothetical protein